MKRKTTSFKIDPEIWKKVKIYCAEKEIDIADFLEESIKEKLEK